MSGLQKTKVRTIDKIAMWLLGAINNLPYTIGIASADRIVREFNNPTYLGLVLWANNLSGLFARFMNTALIAHNVSYAVTFGFCAFLMALGLVGCAISGNFWLTLVGVFFNGFSSSFGESVLLCFITSRKKQDLLAFWSSGTGMSSFLGAGYSLVCALFQIDYFWSFIAVTPVVLVYIICFYCILYRSPMEPAVKNDYEMATSGPDSYTDLREDNSKITDQSELLNEEHVSCCDFHIFKPVWYSMANCSAVYFLEYAIQGAFIHCAQRKEDLKIYTFSLLNLCYQIGKFFSRSSLSFFRVPYVGTISFLQTCFFAAWATQPFFYWMPYWLMITLMVIIGFIGGLSYVNCIYLIMNNEVLSSKQKEMVVSWNSFFASLFIVLATLFTFFAEQTFLKDKVPD